MPSVFADSVLNTPDEDAFAGGVPPGASAVDAPLPGTRWLLDELREGFSLKFFNAVKTQDRADNDVSDLELFSNAAASAVDQMGYGCFGFGTCPPGGGIIRLRPLTVARRVRDFGCFAVP